MAWDLSKDRAGRSIRHRRATGSRPAAGPRRQVIRVGADDGRWRDRFRRLAVGSRWQAVRAGRGSGDGPMRVKAAGWFRIDADVDGYADGPPAAILHVRAR